MQHAIYRSANKSYPVESASMDGGTDVSVSQPKRMQIHKKGQKSPGDVPEEPLNVPKYCVQILIDSVQVVSARLIMSSQIRAEAGMCSESGVEPDTHTTGLPSLS